MKSEHKKSIVCIVFILILVIGIHTKGTAQGNDVCPSSPPCPASIALSTHLTAFNFPDMGNYLGTLVSIRDTLTLNSGVLYKFNVTAGNAYSWSTSPNYDPLSTENIDTKITIYYDDQQTPIIAQSAGLGEGDLAAVSWRASYTGVVYIMITREEAHFDSNSTGCGIGSYYDENHQFIGDSILCEICIQEMKPSNVELVWGRGHNPNQLHGCAYIIYDSGLNSGANGIRNCYGNNEDGYITIYPDDPTARLKFFGQYNLGLGDSLFIYEGTSPNPPAIPIDTLIGQGNIAEASSIIASDINVPFTLRMVSDDTVCGGGLDMRIRCCYNPGLPTNLEGEMILDTMALLSWDSAAGSDISYNWTLFDSITDTIIAYGTTTDIAVFVGGLTCNQTYYYTISTYSDCVREGTIDYVFSNYFSYPYNVVLSGANRCIGDTNTITLSIPHNVNVSSSLSWDSEIEFHQYITTLDSGEFRISFGTVPVTENYQICVSLISEGGCTADTCRSFSVYSLPNPYVLVDGHVGNIDSLHNEICYGDRVCLQGFGGNTYHWEGFDGPSNSHTPPNPICVSPQINTTYHLDMSDNHSCKNELDFQIIINMPPSVTIRDEEDATRFKDICEGESVTLTAYGDITPYHWQRIDTIGHYIYTDSTLVYDTIQATINSHYVYTDSLRENYDIVNADIALNQNTITVSPEETTTYIVFGYDEKGCRGIDTFTVNVHLSLPLEITPFDTILCQNQSAILQANQYESGTYEWTINGQISGSSHQQQIWGNTAGTVSCHLQYTSQYGCVSSADASVKVVPLPQPYVQAVDAICLGDTTVLQGFGGLIYQWEGFEENENPITVFPTTQTTYNLIVTDTNGCRNSVSHPIVVNQLPVVALGEDRDVCIGNSALLSVTGLTSWHWYSADTTWNPNHTIPYISWSECGIPDTAYEPTPTGSTTYMVEGTDANGCVGRDTITITSHRLSDVFLSPSDTNICIGDTVTLSVLEMAQCAYFWSAEGSAQEQGSNVYDFFANTTGTHHFFVQLRTDYGCDTTVSTHVIVNSLPTPQILASASEICAGNSIQLTASGGAEYVWTAPNFTSTQNSLIVSPQENTTYTVTATDANGCSNTADVAIVVNPDVANEPISDIHLCYGDSVEVPTSGAAASYRWYVDGQLCGMGPALPINAPQQTTEYQVVYATDFGCADTTHFSVFVHRYPISHISDNTTICEGASHQISVDGASHYQWDDENHSTTNSITVSPSETTTYHVTLYDTILCKSHDSVTVNVIEYFPLSIYHSRDSICDGQSVTFTANGGDSFVWSNGENDQTVTVIPSVNPYIISLQAANESTGCSSIAHDTIIIMPLPNVEVDAISSTVCAGTHTTLSAIGNAASYVWSTGDSGTQVSVSPVRDTRYYVTATTTFGCVQNSSYDIHVRESPDILVTLSEDTICYNTTNTIIHAQTTNLGLSYHWSDIAENVNHHSYFPQQNITIPYSDRITLMVEDENGCRGFDTATIYVLPMPREELTMRDYLCINDTDTLSLSGNNHYLWDSPIPQIDNTSAEQIVSPSENTIYSVNITNSYGCSITLQDSLIVRPLPSIHVTSNNTAPNYCEGASYTLTATGASTYHWSDGQTQSPMTIHPMHDGTYTVTGTDDYGCTAIDSLSIHVLRAPSLTINVQPALAICAHESVSLSALGNFNGITWSTGDTTPLVTIDHLTSTTQFVATGTHMIEGQRCSASDSLTVIVYPVPRLFEIENTAPFCSNSTGTITVTGADYYEWVPNDILGTHDGATATIVPPTDTIEQNYTISVIGYLNAFNCNAELQIPITIYPLPVINITSDATNGAICEGESAQLTAAGGFSYQWATEDDPETIISLLSSISVSPTQTTTYVVTATNIYRCSDISRYTLVVNSNPEVNLSASPQTICYGHPVALSAQTDIGNNFEWHPGNTLDDRTLQFPVGFPLSTTTYDVRVTDTTTGCHTDKSIDVVVNMPPQIEAHVDNAVCWGNEVELSVNGTTSYEWFYGIPTNIIHTGNNYTALPQDIPTTYYGIIGTDDNGCKDTIELAVQVNAAPEITLAVSSPGYLCDDANNYLGITAFSSEEGTMYTWSSTPLDSNMAINQNVAFVAPHHTTTYSVVGRYTENGATCYSESSVEVLVRSVPSISATAIPDIVCSQQDAVLEASGALHYVWFSEEEIVGTNPTLVVSPTETSYFIVVGEDEFHCASRDTVVVTVAEVPPTESIDGPRDICYNVPTPLFTSGSNHCEWFPNTGLSDISDNGVTVTITEDIDYRVIYTNINGCKDSLDLHLHVLPVPDVQALGDTTICQGASVDMRVSGATSYEWSNGITNNFQTVTPNESTIYHVTGTNFYGCPGSDSVVIEVIPHFDLDIVASRNSFCIEDNSIVLTAHGAGDDYIWSTGSHEPQITVFPTTDSTITLTAINGTTICPAVDSVRLHLMPPANFQITSSVSLLCMRDTAILSAISSDENTYQWNTGESSNQIFVNPLETTTYTVIAHSPFGCVASAEYELEVVSPQELSISNDTLICFGDTVRLSVSGSWNYMWNTGDVSSTLYVSPEETTTYSVSSTDSHGCVTTAEVVVAVNPQFAAFLNNSSDTICIGENVNISYYGAGDTYLWNTGSTSSSIMIAPNETSIYSLTVTNSVTGCSVSRADTIYVINYPQFDLNGNVGVICAYDELEIHVNSDFDFDYIWSATPTGSIMSNTNSPLITVSPLTTTTYTFHATNDYCSFSDDVTIQVLPLPEVVISQIVNETCEQNNGEIHLQPISESSNLTYSWSNGITTTETDISGLEAGIYDLSVTDEFGCTNSYSNNVIESIPIPEINPIQISGSTNQADGSITIEVISASNVYSIDWYNDLNGDLIPGFTDSTTISGLNPGTYWVLVTDEYCSQWASFTIPYETLPDEIYAPNAFTPNGDGINDYFEVAITGDAQFKSVDIMERWGMNIYHSDDPNFKWDGSYKGKIMRSQVYVYVIQYLDAHNNFKIKYGTVTIL